MGNQNEAGGSHPCPGLSRRDADFQGPLHHGACAAGCGVWLLYPGRDNSSGLHSGGLLLHGASLAAGGDSDGRQYRRLPGGCRRDHDPVQPWRRRRLRPQRTIRTAWSTPTRSLDSAPSRNRLSRSFRALAAARLQELTLLHSARPWLERWVRRVCCTCLNVRKILAEIIRSFGDPQMSSARPDAGLGPVWTRGGGGQAVDCASCFIFGVLQCQPHGTLLYNVALYSLVFVFFLQRTCKKKTEKKKKKKKKKS